MRKPIPNRVLGLLSLFFGFCTISHVVCSFDYVFCRLYRLVVLTLRERLLDRVLVREKRVENLLGDPIGPIGDLVLRGGERVEILVRDLILGGRERGLGKIHLLEILGKVLNAGWVLEFEVKGVWVDGLLPVELLLLGWRLPKLVGLLSIGWLLGILGWGEEALLLVLGIWVGLEILARILVVALGEIFTVHRSCSLKTFFGNMGFAVNECFS
jgi:hypothetical protein